MRERDREGERERVRGRDAGGGVGDSPSLPLINLKRLSHRRCSCRRPSQDARITGDAHPDAVASAFEADWMEGERVTTVIRWRGARERGDRLLLLLLPPRRVSLATRYSRERESVPSSLSHRRVVVRSPRLLCSCSCFRSGSRITAAAAQATPFAACIACLTVRR